MTIVVTAQDATISPNKVYYIAELIDGEMKQGPISKEWGIELEPGEAESLQIFAANHWSVKFRGRLLEDVIESGEVSLSMIWKRDWWKRVVFHDSPEVHLDNIRIGILDCGFNRPGCHFVQRDVSGKEIINPAHRSASHGSRVAGIIDSDLCGAVPGGGLVKNSQIEFMDVSLNRGGYELWDASKMPAAIEMLTEFGVNLINVSGGLVPDLQRTDISEMNANSVLRDSIEEAYENGVVCICAVGNSADSKVYFPASDPNTVGVGAAGICGLYPFPNVGALYEQAARHDGLIEHLVTPPSIFVSPENPRGAGLDCVAPGVALPLRTEEGDVFDYTGSSYATPIVTAALAHVLDDDETYWSKEGSARSEYVKEKLESLCDDLGLSSDVQGHGLVRIKG